MSSRNIDILTKNMVILGGTLPAPDDSFLPTALSGDVERDLPRFALGRAPEGELRPRSCISSLFLMTTRASGRPPPHQPRTERIPSIDGKPPRIAIDS